MSVWFDPGLSVASAHPAPCPDPSYRVLNPLDLPDWDARLTRFPDATIFHTQGWARVLHRTYGFSPVYLVQEKDDNWTQVVPLMEVRSLFGSRRGVSLPFTDACAPLSLPPASFSLSSEREKVPEGRMRVSPLPSDLSQERAKAPEGPMIPPPAPFSLSPEREKVPEGRMRVSPLPSSLSTLNSQLSALLALARSRHWTDLELRPGMPSDPTEPASIHYYNHVVPLHADDASQLDACEPAVRRSLRKAQSSGLRLAIGASSAEMDAYFGLHCLTRRRQGAPPQPMQFFNHLRQELLEPGLGFVVLAWQGSQAVAGAVFLNFGSRAVYKFGASDLAYQSLRPNQWVMWNGIRHAASLGCTHLDLGRTSLHNEGLRRFKRNWGAEERIEGGYRTELKSGRLVPTPDRTTGWQTALFRHLPVSVSRWIGNRIYRFAA